MSEQRKHTPGPWEVYNPNEGTGLMPLWCVANDEYHNPTDEDTPCFDAIIECGSKEDAYLIAAAPQLYETLEAAEKTVNEAVSGVRKVELKEWLTLIRFMQLALAKARGEG